MLCTYEAAAVDRVVFPPDSDSSSTNSAGSDCGEMPDEEMFMNTVDDLKPFRETIESRVCRRDVRVFSLAERQLP